ncbi:MAG: SEC-C motif-containing protein [Psychromonas sp.]|jgi:SEC-C motif-containing protein|uniref:YchJ family protein n=1 Tax=Psychromonas sp. TaxID=1884585 RepID=UPI0039E2391C
MSKLNQQTCPCKSAKTYHQCCFPLHQKTVKPVTCEQLMRARFSAFVYQLGDYLYATYHPDYRGDLSIKVLSEKTVDWKNLQIISTASFSDSGYVEFKAWCLDQGKLFCHHERSNFVKENNDWLYCDGVIYPEQKSGKIARNEPCPCGSGKKHKKCCAK